MQRTIPKEHQFTLKLKVYKLDLASRTVVPYNMAAATQASTYFIGSGKMVQCAYQLIDDYIIIASNAEWLNTMEGSYSLCLTLTDSIGTFTGTSPDVLTFEVTGDTADPLEPRQIYFLNSLTLQPDTDATIASTLDTTWPATPTDTKAPSTKLVKTTLDTKLSVSTAATTYATQAALTAGLNSKLGLSEAASTYETSDHAFSTYLTRQEAARGTIVFEHVDTLFGSMSYVTTAALTGGTITPTGSYTSVIDGHITPVYTQYALNSSHPQDVSINTQTGAVSFGASATSRSIPVQVSAYANRDGYAYTQTRTILAMQNDGGPTPEPYAKIGVGYALLQPQTRATLADYTPRQEVPVGQTITGYTVNATANTILILAPADRTPTLVRKINVFNVDLINAQTGINDMYVTTHIYSNTQVKLYQFTFGSDIHSDGTWTIEFN